MSPKSTSTTVLNTSADLSALAQEVSRSVAGEGGHSKRSKHVEKAKLQQARQNLNEVENLYFHHYRNSRPPVPSIPRRGTGAPSISAKATNPIPGPSGLSATSSKSSNTASHVSISAENPATSDAKDGASTSSTKVDVATTSATGSSGSSAPSANLSTHPPDPTTSNSSTSPTQTQTQDVSTSALAIPLSERVLSPRDTEQSSRQANRPRPYPMPSTSSTPSHPMTNRSSTSPHLVPTPATSLSRSGSQHTHVAKSGPSTPFSRSPTKSPTKARQPTGTTSIPGSPTKHLTKTTNKNTSTPSTLHPPQTAENTTAYKVPSALTPNAGTQTTGKSSGPTSYESFWNSMGNGGIGGLGVRKLPGVATGTSVGGTLPFEASYSPASPSTSALAGVLGAPSVSGPSSYSSYRASASAATSVGTPSTSVFPLGPSTSSAPLAFTSAPAQSPTSSSFSGVMGSEFTVPPYAVSRSNSLSMAMGGPGALPHNNLILMGTNGPYQYPPSGPSTNSNTSLAATNSGPVGMTATPDMYSGPYGATTGNSSAPNAATGAAAPLAFTVAGPPIIASDPVFNTPFMVMGASGNVVGLNGGIIQGPPYSGQPV
ncbi:hypothetical protein FRB99_007788 [Tulasnella sp. 403]|nr:hypothetical protein FRB99_007788 [Tulasnella sp. 403]